ncbi:hypothetical protein ACTFIW_013319 [Dictyostelium discoideum]
MSRKLTGSQLNWTVLEKEAYSIVKSIELHHFTIIIKTDHQNIEFLRNQRVLVLNQRINRWMQKIDAYNVTLEYIRSVTNTAADGLSRSAYNNNIYHTTLRDRSKMEFSQITFYSFPIKDVKSEISHWLTVLNQWNGKEINIFPSYDCILATNASESGAGATLKKENKIIKTWSFEINLLLIRLILLSVSRINSNCFSLE